MTGERRRYDVELHDRETQIGRVTVEAEDERQAEEIARQLASTASADIDWTPDYHEPHGIEVNAVHRSGARAFRVETRDNVIRESVFEVEALNAAEARELVEQERGDLMEESDITISNRVITHVEERSGGAEAA